MTANVTSRLGPAPDPAAAAELRALLDRFDFSPAAERLMGVGSAERRLALLVQRLPEGPLGATGCR